MVDMAPGLSPVTRYPSRSSHYGEPCATRNDISTTAANQDVPSLLSRRNPPLL